MNNNLKIMMIAAVLVAPSFALDLGAVFSNQKKAAFPDTCEMHMKTTVLLPGMQTQVVETDVLTAGESKSITTIKSSMMQMKMVKNGDHLKVIDLKTGKTMPSQNIPAENPADVNKQMGSPEDYNAPVKEGSLWKITPKDASKPTLYYSTSKNRVMKMTMNVAAGNLGMTTAESVFEYCDNSCLLPGTLKKVTITSQLPTGGESKVVVDVTNAKQRKALPSRMFDFD